MLTRADVEAILALCQYEDWTFRLGWDEGHYEISRFEANAETWVSGTDHWIQVQFMANDQLQSCRKWRISVHMTTSEIVQTAFAAVLAANEHEVREEFHYRGVNVFGPHLSVDDLITAIDHGHLRLDVR